MSRPHKKGDRPTYDVALSFAGEDRVTAEKLATELRQRKVSVFYDGFAEAELWGKDLYDYLSQLYSDGCRYCVMLVSRAYAKKDWTRLERRSAQSRSLSQPLEFILPVRLDDTKLPGLRARPGRQCNPRDMASGGSHHSLRLR